jgi:hypothetical protein
MDTLGKILFFSLTILCIYDFYQLRKFKIKLTKCLVDSILTFILGLMATSLLGVIISMIFDSSAKNVDPYLYIALSVVIIFNVLRFRSRKLLKGKIVQTEDSAFTYFSIGIVGFLFISFLLWLGYFYVVASIGLWDIPSSQLTFGNHTLLGSIVILANNILYYFFGIFSNKIASIIIFIMGSFLLVSLSSLLFVFIKEFNFKKLNPFKRKRK